MIIGGHIMLQSTDAAADKAFFADVLKLSSVDAGGGFLIFGLPPTEIAVHESDRNDLHIAFLMCDDIEAFVAEMDSRGIPATPPDNQGWGTLSMITLPGGGKLGVYQPHHARPAAVGSHLKKAPARAKARAKKPARTKKKVAQVRKPAKTAQKRGTKKKKAKKR